RGRALGWTQVGRESAAGTVASLLARVGVMRSRLSWRDYVTRNRVHTCSVLPVYQRLGQQRHERFELDVGGGGDLFVGAVERAPRQTRLGVDELGDLGVDRLGGDDPPGGDGFGLPDPVDPVDGLGLLGVGPGE